MSDQQIASSSEQVPRLSTPEGERFDSDTSSLPGGVYFCICGEPDASRKWIHCDSVDCPVGWHHWQCVGVTEKPSRDWVCPRCTLKSTEDAELPKRREGNTSMSAKLEKDAVTAFNRTLGRDSKSGQKVADKARARKGTAIKKATPKKRSKWVGWVETSSESEEELKESLEAARKAVTVAEGRVTKARATQSKRRLTRPQPLRGTSKPVAGVNGKGRMEPNEEEVNEKESEGY